MGGFPNDHPFIYLIKYLWISFYVAGIVLGTGDEVVNKTKNVMPLRLLFRLQSVSRDEKVY